jgi:hypothetical protein
MRLPALFAPLTRILCTFDVDGDADAGAILYVTVIRDNSEPSTGNQTSAVRLEDYHFTEKNKSYSVSLKVIIKK